MKHGRGTLAPGGGNSSVSEERTGERTLPCSRALAGASVRGRGAHAEEGMLLASFKKKDPCDLQRLHPRPGVPRFYAH